MSESKPAEGAETPNWAPVLLVAAVGALVLMASKQDTGGAGTT